jgi:hypothetical protein
LTRRDDLWPVRGTQSDKLPPRSIDRGFFSSSSKLHSDDRLCCAAAQSLHNARRSGIRTWSGNGQLASKSIMGVHIDLTGRRFGRLIVLRKGKNRGRRVTWLCQCKCGQRKTLVADYLTSKHYRSCGCLRNEKTGRRSTTHGDTRSRLPSKEYRAWHHMKGRCYNPFDPRYPGCGGKGIKVCHRWRDSFPAFLRDLGRAPPNTNLKRRHLDLDYEPGNCSWELRSKRKLKFRNRRSL